MSRPDPRLPDPPGRQQVLPGPPSAAGAQGSREPSRRGRTRAGVWRRLWVATLRDADTAGFSPSWALAVFWLPAVGGLLVAATFVHKPLFYWLLAEDHPVEWTQFGLLVFSTSAAALGAVRMARRGRWLSAALYVMFVLGAFALAGEEISWGQRVFGLGEPAALAAANDQHELNLHNIDAGGLNLDALSDYVSSLLSAALLVLSLAVRLPRGSTHPPSRFWGRDYVRAVSPALVFIPALALSAVYSWGQLISAVGGTGAFWGFEEWAEFCRYLSLAGLAAVTTAGSRGPLRLDSARRAHLRKGPRLLEPALVLFAALSAAVTIVFAVLTIHTGLKPVNAPR